MIIYTSIHIICFYFLFFFNDTATTEIYTLSLHDALPIYFVEDVDEAQELPLGHRRVAVDPGLDQLGGRFQAGGQLRSEEHTSELQSRRDLVCRLLLEKKKKNKQTSQLHKIKVVLQQREPW